MGRRPRVPPVWFARPAGSQTARMGVSPAHRIKVPPMPVYQRQVSGVPLTGGQVQGTISAQGTATLSVGPQGLGNVWYPAQAVISTSAGASDGSTCALYLGAISNATLLGGQSYAGGGDSLGLAVPPLTPGQLIIAVWSGGTHNDTCTLNVIGTMDALTW